MNTITKSGSFLLIGSYAINIARILFFDHDLTNVYIVMSDRKEGHSKDQNTITVAYLDITSPQTFASAEALQTYLVAQAQA